MEESREMATIEGAQPDYLQVAKLLRERLNDFIEGEWTDSFEQPVENISSTITLNGRFPQGCFMYPYESCALGTSSKGVVGACPARLAVPEITRLRCQLSKEWTTNVEFDRACDEANPKMPALVLCVGHSNQFWVRIFDFNKYTWLYVYRLRLTNRNNVPSWFDSVGIEPGVVYISLDPSLFPSDFCSISTIMQTISSVVTMPARRKEIYNRM